MLIKDKNDLQELVEKNTKCPQTNTIHSQNGCIISRILDLDQLFWSL